MKNYSELPVPIIHLIHSLLTDKEAAQTALVSRSWAFARSTRPIIFLDEDRVPLPILAVIANKTFKRYEESNLPIHTFRLCLNRQWYVTPPEWISKALKLGASDITIRVNKNRNFHVPMAEIFGSENVVRLCLENLIISRLKVVKCSGLESLALTLVDLSFDSFCTIISSCPVIKHLSLTSPRFKFSDDEPSAQLRTMYLTTISHHKLTSLDLCHVELDQLRTLFLRDFSSKFPVLRELTITVNEHVFQQAYQIRVISSLSLEIFNFRLTGGGKSFCPEDLRRVELDLPSIRKFTFEGSCMPKMWLRPTLEDQWEDFHVSMSHRGHPSTTWFRQMCKFLTNLERSNIHLTLHVRGSRFSSDYKVLEIKGLNARKVKFLSVYTEEGLGSKFFNSLLDGMFWVCRPKMVTHYADPSYRDTYRSWDDHNYRKITNNGLLLCRALQLGMKRKNIISWEENYWTKHGLLGLEDVHAQELQDEVWMPQEMDSILDDSSSEERSVRFKLKWKILGC